MSDRDANEYIRKEMKDSYRYAEPAAGIAYILPVHRSHGPTDDLAFPVQRNRTLFLH